VVSPLEAEVLDLAARGLPLDATSDAWLREAAQRVVAARLWPDAVYS
jgi:hypothetical protein